ncbi:Ty1/Copia family ribonuclease HI [Aspergillus affinis]|uniref:Ty1/Copia family ribonuclease HI n=1 Tax=Aspergillus affinis TaxID=1070780 RepID=UPI0022FEC724|nr:uncharacterized protein KD926_002124 [Aspergillus affinis]KAI9036259.1 hypothetical protein KD926_002124 [Aspergillus affinis]
MAHLHWDALRHLPEAATGVQIDDFKAKQNIDKEKCEVCKVSYALRQISRRPMMKAEQSFQCVHSDLIQMTPALNGDQWISHFYDEMTRFHFLTAHRRKSECVNVIISFTRQMKNLFGYSVKFFKSDHEQTLCNTIKDFEALEGIVHEYSVVGTPEQDGPTERAGSIARKLMIEARLPRDLWPWVSSAAANIANRTPTAALQWKTPYERITGRKPDLSGFRTVGCIAYTRQDQERSDKMAPRAYRGVLLGFVASNIWHIWNPKEQRAEEATDSSLEPPTEVLNLPRGEGIFLEENTDQTESAGITGLPENVPDSASNDEIGEKSDGGEVAEGQGVIPSGQTEHPAQPGPLPTPKPTPEPNAEFHDNLTSDQRRTDTIPGGFPERSDDPPRDESPSRILQDSLQIAASADRDPPLEQTTQRDDFEMREDHDSQHSSRSRGRRRIGPTDDGTREENILRTRRAPKPKRDPQYVSHMTVESFVEAPRIEKSFFIAMNLAERERYWHRSDLPPPNSYTEILQHPLKNEFLHAAHIEVGNLKAMDAFDLVEIDEARNSQILPLKWVFTYKLYEDGNFIKAKGRICVIGDLERDTVGNNFAATASARAFRAVMALVAAFDIDTDQKDMSYERWERKLWLCQDAYLSNVAVKSHLNDLTRWPDTALSSSLDLSPYDGQATEAKIMEYSMKIGSAQYPAMITRPDIAHAISRLSETLKNPSPDHIQAANRVIAYLYATRFLAIEYAADSNIKEVIVIGSDAAFADRPDRSSAGYLVKLYNGPIEWKSGKQRAVTTSTTEVEFLVLSEAAKATYWWSRVFNTMGFDPQHEMFVSCDNQQTVRLAN